MIVNIYPLKPQEIKIYFYFPKAIGISYRSSFYDDFDFNNDYRIYIIYFKTRTTVAFNMTLCHIYILK